MMGKTNRKKRLTGFSIAALITFLMMVSGFGSPLLQTGLFDVFAATTVSSWGDLKTAVGSGETEIILGDSFAYDGTSIEIPDRQTVTIKGQDKTIYSSAQSSYDSMFKVKGSLTIDSGVTLSGKIGQQCPDGDTLYTAEKFTGTITDTDYEPKGFFIDVKSGGSATLKGTLSDFVTSRDKATTPKYVAPVVANGTDATFNVEGGTIKNNLVGYIVDDNKANEDAQTIKMYVKGGGPNVPRVPNARTQKQKMAGSDRPRNTDAGIDGGSPGTGLTGTAGAVIYKGGAKGTIDNSSSITNNRADTGGIMVSGTGTEVNVGTENGDPEAIIFSKNVGVQFGGGSTAEQGGVITMNSGKYTENVAWFGGGAVYATENGIAWLMGLMYTDDSRTKPNFEAREHGEFVMYDGALHNNTSLTRGGAILADSDGVQIIKGKLTDNKSRMLGGAVYVMGDHPEYTYTMHLTGLYVHDNLAVTGTTKYYDNVDFPNEDRYVDANKELQTKLSAANACGEAPASLFSGTDDLITKNTDDMTDGPGTQGTGGGVWLCAYGNTILDAGATDKVVIANNYATGTPPFEAQYYSNYNYLRNNTDPPAVRTRNDIITNSGDSSLSNTGKSGGSDIHADTGDSGTVVISGVSPSLDNPYTGWKNENSQDQSLAGSTYQDEVSQDRLNLINKGTTTMNNPMVEVSGNIARRGGGLAADGTYILGPVDDQATVEAGMGVAKEWVSGVQSKEVVMRVDATSDGKKAHVIDLTLDGVANPPASDFDTAQELEPTTNEAGNIVWNGKFALPLTLTATDGTTIPVFDFALTYANPIEVNGVEVTLNNTSVDITKRQGKSYLAALIKRIKLDNAGVDPAEKDAKILEALKKAVKIQFKDHLHFTLTEWEKNSSDELVEVKSYVFAPKDIALDEANITLNSTPHTEKVEDPENPGQYMEVETFQAHIFGVNLVLPASNDNQAITEKYVNKKVHDNIVNFDQEFTYDIMGYVPMEATEFTITDTLVDGLEFAKPNGDKAETAADSIEKITIKVTNDHQEEGSVSQSGMPDRGGREINIKDGATKEITNSGKTLTVKIDKNTTYQDSDSASGGTMNALEALRGKWVQVTFHARIKDEYRNLDALKALTDSWSEDSEDKFGGDITNGEPPVPYDVEFANSDLVIGQMLLNDKKIGSDPVVWAVEAPSRLFARTANGDYYGTPMSDNKQGQTWEGPFEEGSADWRNANNRFNGTGAEGANTIRHLDLADGSDDETLVTNLKEMPRIKGSTLDKGAEGASRLFIQVKNPVAVTAENPDGIEIYATPNNDKSGTTWVGPLTDDDGAVYKNALDRLNNDRFTIRMLDFESGSIKIPADDPNWPVLTDEEHHGMQNNADFNVKFANGSESTFRTNTVTVEPETTEIDVEKTWNINGKNQWPDDVTDVTFGIYAKNIDNKKELTVYVDADGKVVCLTDDPDKAPAGSKPLTIKLTRDDPATTDVDESKATVDELPRLIRTIYYAREIKINDKDVTYSDANNASAITDISDDPEEPDNIITAASSAYKGDGALLETLAREKNLNPYCGAIAKDPEDEDRLWALAYNGDYYSTKDTTGKTGWEKINKPGSSASATDPEVLKYDRAREVLGAIDPSDQYSVTPPTETADKFFYITGVFKAENMNAFTEKYVNNDVHADLVEYDKAFKYDLMVYVPAGSTKLVISDPLVEELEFAEAMESLDDANTSAAKATTDPAKSIAAVVYKDKNDHTADSTVSGKDQDNEGTAITDYNASIEGKTLKLEFENKNILGQEQPLTFAGKWVQVTFWAKYTDEVIGSGDTGTYSNISDNGAVISEDYPGRTDEDPDDYVAHSGTKNKAEANISVGNDYSFDLETNEVTVKPETIRLEVLKTWHQGKTKDWDPDVTKIGFGIYEKDPQGRETPVKGTVDDQTGEITLGGKENATFDLTRDRMDFTVEKLPRKIGVTYVARELEIDGKPISSEEIEYTPTYEEEPVEDQGQVVGNRIKVNNKIQTEPEIEKYVNKAVHKYIELDETFTYDIIAYVTKDADTVTITDKLDEVLSFAGDEGSVSVVDLGKKDNHKVENNISAVKINKDATVSESGEKIDAAVVTISGRTLTVKIENKLIDGTTTYTPVTIESLTEVDPSAEGYFEEDGSGGYIQTTDTSAEDGKTYYKAETSAGPSVDPQNQPVTDLRGHWIKITFTACVYGKTLDEVRERYKTIKDSDIEEDRAESNEGNDPVQSDEDHNGVPNYAEYTIGVFNGVSIEEDVHEDKSNTVTVKPDKESIYFSKKALGGDELEGATIRVTDEEGNVVDEWSSTKEAKLLDLLPGKYKMEEVVAPRDYQRVTTVMEFTVDGLGNVTLLTGKVEGGRLSVDNNNHIILEDAPIKVDSKGDGDKDVAPDDNNPDGIRPEKSAGTGDTTNILLLSMLMIMTAIAITVMMLRRRASGIR